MYTLFSPVSSELSMLKFYWMIENLIGVERQRVLSKTAQKIEWYIQELGSDSIISLNFCSFESHLTRIRREKTRINSIK